MNRQYELEFKDGNVEYDVEVDAYTEKVLEVERDLEDYVLRRQAEEPGWISPLFLWRKLVRKSHKVRAKG